MSLLKEFEKKNCIFIGSLRFLIISLVLLDTVYNLSLVRSILLLIKTPDKTMFKNKNNIVNKKYLNLLIKLFKKIL